jgi:hypothetical protein
LDNTCLVFLSFDFLHLNCRLSSFDIIISCTRS